MNVLCALLANNVYGRNRLLQAQVKEYRVNTSIFPQDGSPSQFYCSFTQFIKNRLRGDGLAEMCQELGTLGHGILLYYIWGGINLADGV